MSIERWWDACLRCCSFQCHGGHLLAIIVVVRVEGSSCKAAGGPDALTYLFLLRLVASRGMSCSSGQANL